MDLMMSAFQISGLSVYRNLKKDPAVAALIGSIVKADGAVTGAQELEAVKEYGEFCSLLYESGFLGNFSDYLFSAVLYDENVFTRAAAAGTEDRLSSEVKRAVQVDLKALYELATLTSREIKEYFKDKISGIPDAVKSLPEYATGLTKFAARGDWSKNPGVFADFCRANGTGAYAKYSAFRFDPERGIVPVTAVDPIRLADLKQYQMQRDKIVENTKAFLCGHPFNNVLLYGDRGTGKSSTVKALLNEFSKDRLRMVEVGKRYVAELDKVIAALAGVPLKFIVFIDDLSFNENDDDFGILKAALEGSLAVRPDNVAIYATTNRRHLVKETFSAREGNEVHRGDTLDESLSLSDRFGLTVTFMKPDRDEYLRIVRAIASDRGLKVDEDKLNLGAERFALASSGRSPRVARQYVDWVESRIKMKLEI